MARRLDGHPVLPPASCLPAESDITFAKGDVIPRRVLSSRGRLEVTSPMAKSDRYTFTLPARERFWLSELARSNHLSRAKVIRLLIRDAAKRVRLPDGEKSPALKGTTYDIQPSPQMERTPE
jgi:hypothetical protein